MALYIVLIFNFLALRPTLCIAKTRQVCLNTMAFITTCVIFNLLCCRGQEQQGRLTKCHSASWRKWLRGQCLACWGLQQKQIGGNSYASQPDPVCQQPWCAWAVFSLWDWWRGIVHPQTSSCLITDLKRVLRDCSFYIQHFFGFSNKITHQHYT